MADFDGVNVPAVLASLKGFQRRSVDYVFDRMYGENPTRRFLLADEAGLGKTHVARGVIAKAIEHVRACGEKRIDIVYICSNADIARQNISRLNVTGKPDFQLATRITLLPQTVSGLAENPLNFCSFTPGTSFDLGHSTGLGEERKLLYWLLRMTWPSLCQGTGAKNVLQGRMSRDKFRQLIHDFDSEENIDRGLAKKFKEGVRQEDADTKAAGKPTYQNRFRDLCQRFARSRKHIPPQDRHDANTFIGEMRALLAKICIIALEPDLIILDEFQRFKDLLNADDPEENPAGVLAKSLFTWEKARVLLLSATPYKMYTLSHELETDDHYHDFVDTLRFLMDKDTKTEQVKHLLTEYGRACARIDRDGPEPLRRAKQDVETALRNVMCRTEKLAVTEDRSGMLRDAGGPLPQLNPKHIHSYLEVRSVADALGHPDVLEYWKSSPYLLNFMETDHYKLKRLLAEAADNGTGKVASTLSRSPTSLLNQASWEAYGEIDLGHALLERLSAQTVDTGWWRMLWMPPSYPYYDLSGPFVTASPTTLTKRLVFSSWHVVPRAISVLLSYEVERLMMTGFDPKAVNTPEERESRRPQLTFSSSGGRLAGLPVLVMLYPSITLASLGDPLAVARGIRASGRPTLEVLLATVAGSIRQALVPLLAQAPETGQEDESWYWAAPILLDREGYREATEAWFSDDGSGKNPHDGLAEAWSGMEADGEGWRQHVRRASEVASGSFKPKGRPPHDLAEVLALGAVAGPANCALRALANTLGGPDLRADGSIRHAAGRIAWGFRSLFNTLEVNALIRGMNKKGPYWRRVLEYSAAGCLQSVLDEYLHILVELEALGSASPSEAACQLAKAVAASVGLRTATPGVDWVKANGSRGVKIDNQRVRARFAMRFGDEGGEHEEGAVRKDAVRAAFNSPFWPFVLATTSIGQEGLDFHPYCHAVMHWNLPSNPVDMEQREGRVHRYKGHAVRKNVAKLAQGSDLDFALGVNPWHQLFQHAAEHAGHDSDISPYWVFPIEGGAVIERHTPALPLSREAARLPALCASLAVYRMVFGQPRQDDLVKHLKRILPEGGFRSLSGDLSINLEPPPIGSSPAQGDNAGNNRR